MNWGGSGGAVHTLLDDLLKLYIHVRVCHISWGKIAGNRKNCKKKWFLGEKPHLHTWVAGTKSSTLLRLIIRLVHPPIYLIAKGYVFYSVLTNNSWRADRYYHGSITHHGQPNHLSPKLSSLISLYTKTRTKLLIFSKSWQMDRPAYRQTLM